MQLLARTRLFLIAVLVAGTVITEGSANIGWASDYYYRGIFQAGSSATGGGQSGFVSDSLKRRARRPHRKIAGIYH